MCAAVSLGFQGCGYIADNSRSLTEARRAAVEDRVRQFTATVAHDVTRDGPIAWRKFFGDGPEFFMAVNGKLAFPDGQSAAKAIPEIARQFKHIELRWGQAPERRPPRSNFRPDKARGRGRDRRLSTEHDPPRLCGCRAVARKARFL